MRISSRWKSGLAALLAAGAVFGASAVSDVANALPPGTPPQNGGGVSLSPSSGSFSTPFNFTFNPINQACPGDNNAGWYYSPYLTADDPAQLTFSASGSPISAGGGRTSALRGIDGDLVRNLFPNLVDGALIPFQNISFENTFATTPLVPGTYNVGVACFNATAQGGLGVRENARYWNTQITVTGAGGVGDTFVEGAAPAAPLISLGAGTGTSQTINLVADASVDSYNLIVTPAPGGALPTVAPGATSFQLTGLTLGTEYDVTLEAVKTGFAPVPSNLLEFSAAATFPGPVVTAPNTFEGNDVTVTWTPPATGPSPVSYDVAVTPGGPSFTGVTGTSQVIPAGLALGDYTATVTPNYAAGSGATGTPGSDTFSITANTLVLQEITVNRPAGALILTQRCGVYGPLDPFVAVDAFPGYPRDLPLEDASSDQIGTAPDIDLGPGYTADPEFDSYPQPSPVTYPTECGLDMDTASLVTSGALAGQFYAADGRLNQVTVVDTRDTDTGWIARGDIEDTFSNGADTFSGDYLGWTPHVTDDSDPVGGSTYDQVVTEGNQILPGTGTTGTGTGLTSNPILAETAGNAGLGIATLDARMALLIPASADAGDYSGTLSLTVLPRVP